MSSASGSKYSDLAKMSEASSMLVGPAVLGAILDWQIWGFPWASMIGVFVGLTLSGRVIYRHYLRDDAKRPEMK